MNKCHCFNIRKSICLLLIFILLSALLVPPTFAEQNTADSGKTLKEKFGSDKSINLLDFSYDNGVGYNSMLLGYKGKGYKPAEPGTIVNVDIFNNVKSSSGNIITMSKNGRNGILTGEETTNIEWTFNVDKSGLYNVVFDYFPVEGRGFSKMIRGIRIDGEYTFRELKTIDFLRPCKEDAFPEKNSVGDQIRPSQTAIFDWITAYMKDSLGMFSEPFQLYLSQGEHTIAMDYTSQPLLIGGISLVAPEKYPSYEEQKAVYLQKGYTRSKASTLKFQAESFDYIMEKSHSTIIQDASGDPTCEPYDKNNKLLNIISGDRWRTPNSYITYSFSVSESGLYKLGLRVLQTNDFMPVYRKVMIDGKVPFEEMLSYPFNYSDKWHIETLSDKNGENYMFYLEKGEHTLTLEANLGGYGVLYDRLSEISLNLSELLNKLFLITGEDPDPNYNYEFNKKLPKLISILDAAKKDLEAAARDIRALSLKEPAVVRTINNAVSDIQKILDDPDELAGYINDLKISQQSITSVTKNLRNQPLSLDYVMLGGEEKEWKTVNKSFFQMLWLTFYNLIRSFSIDYDNVGGVKEDEGRTISVWTGVGKEWAEIIKQLADESFTPESKISVKLNVLPSTQFAVGNLNVVQLALASGAAPDVCMTLASTAPVEYAIRDSVVNLSEFNDFPEIRKRFNSYLFTPISYKGGVYGIPETMNFKVLFYRTDIFNTLGLKPPETWEDLYEHILPALYRNNMRFIYPPDFSALLFQNGAKYFTDDGLQSALNTPEAFEAFREWTGLYTMYGFPAVNLSFFESIRNGEAPIGIADADFYMQISAAAPEITGRWAISPIPGKRKADGYLDRSTSSANAAGSTGTSAVIMSQSENRNEAWEFLKWWTSEEIQTEYATRLETMMGTEARYFSANVAAFEALPWKRSDLSVIKGMYKNYVEVPVLLGSYYNARHVNFAWTDVVLNGLVARDALEKAFREINKEMKIKQNEYRKN